MNLTAPHIDYAGLSPVIAPDERGMGLIRPGGPGLFRGDAVGDAGG